MSAKHKQTSNIFHFLSPYKWHLGSLIALTVVLSVLAMLPPLIIRAIIDRVLTQGETRLFFGLGVCMLTIPVLAALCGYLQTIGIAYLGQRFVFDIRVALYDHLMRLSLRFYGKQSIGKIINRLMGDSGIVQRMLTAQSINVVSDLVCATFAISATFLINWRLACLLLLIVISFVINYRMNIGRIRRATRNYRGALDRLSGGVQNRLGGNLAVKTFGAEGREHGIFQQHSDASLDQVEEALVASNTFSMNTQLIQSTGRAIIYFLGCAMVLRDELSYGDVVAFTTYAMQLLGPAVRFSELIRMLQDVAIAVERLFEIFRELPEITDSADAVDLPILKGQVDFNQVHFHYDEGKPVLRGFDLHVSAGETVALIGPTGCGKSTILSLLQRFFDVCDGSLLLDGHDIRTIRLHSLRRHFGIVLQEPLLFSVSIAENIRYSRQGATLEEIEAAARVAEIHDFIASLPDGYQTQIGSEGLELSVGQKQRVTIARAVVADPAILIMDEATSALDTESEQAIQKAMNRVLEGRTSFIVAHRLSTIRNADRIVFLDGGVIAEMGNHEELMRLPDGRYRELYTKHMSAGVLE